MNSNQKPGATELPGLPQNKNKYYLLNRNIQLLMGASQIPPALSATKAKYTSS